MIHGNKAPWALSLALITASSFVGLAGCGKEVNRTVVPATGQQQQQPQQPQNTTQPNNNAGEASNNNNATPPNYGLVQGYWIATQGLANPMILYVGNTGQVAFLNSALLNASFGANSIAWSYWTLPTFFTQSWYPGFYAHANLGAWTGAHAWAGAGVNLFGLRLNIGLHAGAGLHGGYYPGWWGGTGYYPLSFWNNSFSNCYPWWNNHWGAGAHLGFRFRLGLNLGFGFGGGMGGGCFGRVASSSQQDLSEIRCEEALQSVNSNDPGVKVAQQNPNDFAIRYIDANTFEMVQTDSKGQPIGAVRFVRLSESEAIERMQITDAQATLDAERFSYLSGRWEIADSDQVAAAGIGADVATRIRYLDLSERGVVRLASAKKEAKAGMDLGVLAVIQEKGPAGAVDDGLEINALKANDQAGQILGRFAYGTQAFEAHGDTLTLTISANGQKHQITYKLVGPSVY